MSRKELIEKLKAYGLALKEAQELKDDDGSNKVFETERSAFIAERDLARALTLATREEIETLGEALQ